MATMLSDNASIHNIAILKQELALFINRPKIHIEQSQIRQMGQFFLIGINDKFNTENQIIKSIASKWDDFIHSWTNFKVQYQVQINQMNEEIDEKSIEIDNLQEIVSHFEKKVEYYEQKYETLKSQLLISNQNTIDTYNELTKYKQTNKKTEKELFDKIEQYKHTVSILTNEKQILINQIKEERNLNIDLKQTIQQLTIKIQENHKESKLFSLKNQQWVKHNEELQQLLNQTNNAINILANQIGFKRIQELQRFSSLQLDITKIQFHSKQLQRHQKMSCCNSFIFGFNKKQSIFQLNSNISMDPYFTHFILTSQSVKIKQDSQQLLNIDAKPFYTEIVQKRIPMHIWDQWIRNKLREVLKQQRKMCQSGQSEG